MKTKIIVYVHDLLGLNDSYEKTIYVRLDKYENFREDYIEYFPKYVNFDLKTWYKFYKK